MSIIIIPHNLKDKLSDGSFVHKLLENVEELSSTPTYFPEYSLHNHRHINAVMELSSQLIPHTTLDKLTSKAVEILIGAIVLHDLGMFIHRAGLKRLIFKEHENRYNKYLNELSWNKTWENFYQKALRYNEFQLIHIFGDKTPIEKLPANDIPKSETKRQRLLYGEFIRQNHHRLAFDIAEFGFPGDNIDIDVFKNCECHKAIRTMIGLVAQSHGMKLRDTEEFLKHNILTIQDVPIFYLMTVLRIADYLHIGPKRASEFMELTDEISSPESKRQFHLNQVIFNEPVFDYERKAVNISAEPNNSSTYENVETLLNNIQQELDSCWAILAEKYAYEYELSIHRLTSNLFDECKKTSFNEQFLTSRAKLDVNPDIAKLLIGPLYDNNPSYGVRELIQNAVDACNERAFIDKKVTSKIDILIDTEKETFDIIDNGIGMNEDILKNYFLVAGSSYRSSSIWREKYISEKGNAKIERIGRFGIGALASFLIGDEITVTTRYIDDESGYQFTFSLESKTLDVKRVPKDEPGTMIKIKLHKESLEYFSDESKWSYYGSTTKWFQWYHFSKPELCYYLNGKKIEKDIFIIPEKGIDKDGWYDAKSEVFQNMKLNYTGITGATSYSEAQIIVNGIIVDKWNKYSYSKVSLPDISIIDRDNKLDINLKRTKILNFPESITIEEMFKYYLANILAMPETDVSKLALCKFTDKRIVVSNNGYTLLDPFFIHHTKQQKVVVLYYEYNNYKSFFDKNLLSEIPIVTGDYYSFHNLFNYEYSFHNLFNYELSHNKQSFIKYWCKSTSTLVRIMGGTVSIDFDKLKPDTGSPPLNLNLSDKLVLIIEYILTEYVLTKLVEKFKEKNLVLDLLQEYIPINKNGGWIPFDMDERKKLYSKAFSELGRYMQDSYKHYKHETFQSHFNSNGKPLTKLLLRIQ